MNYTEKLLDGLEVEWTVLGDERFVEVANGPRRPVKASMRIAGGIPYYGANNIQDYVEGYTHDGEYVLIAEDGSASLDSYSIQYATGKFWANNHVHVVRGIHGLSTKFLYHYLRTVDFTPYLPNKDRSKLTKGEMMKIRLPIPCPDNTATSLRIQTDIVRILDTFTELTTKLTTKLTTELTARKTQYKYYRDELLSFEDDAVEWRALGAVAEFRRGTAITQKETTPGGIPVVANGPIPTYRHGESNREGETIVIARSGAYAGYVSYWNEPIFLTDAFSVHPNTNILIPKFVYHALQNKQDRIHQMKKGAGVPHVRVKEFESYVMPIPSLDQQARIVTILDKFDSLTNSITRALPREIELRQNQYTYYRDLLLNFPEREEVEA